MGDFIAHNSRPRIVGLVLLAVGFVLLGLWLIGAFGPSPVARRYPAPMVMGIGWMSLILFGLAGIAWAKKLFDKRAQLQIGPPGIRWRPWSDQLIPWAEVRDVTTWEMQRQKLIVLHLRDPARFPGRGLNAVSASINRRLAGGDIFISLTGTDQAFDDAIAAVMLFKS